MPIGILITLLLVSTVRCGPAPTPGEAEATESGSAERRVLEAVPRPDDADPVPVSQGFDWGFTTRLIEPELFDFYTESLEDGGWRRQAPTEAVVAPPHQVWRKNQYRLLIEIHGVDERGRTIVWLQVADVDRDQ